MRKVVIWGIVLVCLTVLIAGSGATAQRARVIEAAAASKPSQVEVTNFPAVQEVSGSVQVGNLPLDGDGNVRVAGVAPGPSYQWTQIAANVPVSVAAPITIGPFPVGGWTNARVIYRVTITSYQGSGINAILSFGGGDYFTVLGQGGVGYTSTQGPIVLTAVTEVGGPEMMVRFQMDGSDQTATAVVDQVWLYLSN